MEVKKNLPIIQALQAKLQTRRETMEPFLNKLFLQQRQLSRSLKQKEFFDKWDDENNDKKAEESRDKDKTEASSSGINATDRSKENKGNGNSKKEHRKR